MNEAYQVRDLRLVAMDRVLAAAQAVRTHWDEFGPEAGFTEYMEALDQALTRWDRLWPDRDPAPPDRSPGQAPLQEDTR